MTVFWTLQKDVVCPHLSKINKKQIIKEGKIAFSFLSFKTSSSSFSETHPLQPSINLKRKKFFWNIREESLQKVINISCRFDANESVWNILFALNYIYRTIDTCFKWLTRRTKVRRKKTSISKKKSRDTSRQNLPSIKSRTSKLKHFTKKSTDGYQFKTKTWNPQY